MASSLGRTITGYAWTITASPPTGPSLVSWAPTPPTAATESFLPRVVGSYTIHVVATDSMGATGSCDTHVDALRQGLRLELTWDGSTASGDLDLHLHNNVGTSPWFNIPNDCFYNDVGPMWDAVGTADDPSFDFDSTIAPGPEAAHINAPVIGESYTIGVHNYRGGAGRHATVNVYCGSSSTPAATRISRALTGSGAGNCTANDFWKVATVTFTSATACTVTPIDTYVASSTACTAF